MRRQYSCWGFSLSNISGEKEKLNERYSLWWSVVAVNGDASDDNDYSRQGWARKRKKRMSVIGLENSMWFD